MAGKDPFAEFGGNAVEDKDPFAAFGGKTVESEDPFAKFGGKVVSKPDIIDRASDAVKRTVSAVTESKPYQIAAKAAPFVAGLAGGPVSALDTFNMAGAQEADAQLGQKVQEAATPYIEKSGANRHVQDVAKFVASQATPINALFLGESIAAGAKNLATAKKLTNLQEVAGKVGPTGEVVKPPVLPIEGKGGQLEMPLTGEAPGQTPEQLKMFNENPQAFAAKAKPPTNSPSNVIVPNDIAQQEFAKFGKKYGGISRHLPEELEGWARTFTEKGQEAAFKDVDEWATRYIVPEGEKGTLVGKQYKFDSPAIANQFASELKNLLKKRYGQPVQGELLGAEAGTPTSPLTAPQPSLQQASLFDTAPSKGTPTDFFEKPGVTPAMKLSDAIQGKQLPAPFTSGAVDRMNKVQELAGKGALTDIDAANPLTDRVHFNERVEGTDRGVLFDQMKAAGLQKVEARNTVIKERLEVKNKFGIEAGSAESKAAQIYGEAANKDAALQGLESEFGKPKAAKIKALADHLRTRYDHYWVEVNKTRMANGQDMIPYRQDYFTHFTEFSLFNDLGILGNRPASVLNEIGQQMTSSLDKYSQSKFTRVRDVLFRFTKRMAGEYDSDAVSGFDRYVSSANNLIKMQPVINELNATADALAKTHPHAATYLKDQANFLGGGMVGMDKMVADTIGKEFLRTYSAMTKNMVGNIVEGNPSVAFSQLFGEIPTFSANPAQDFVRAAFRQATDNKLRAFALDHSQVLMDRAQDAAERNINAGLVRKSLSAVTQFLDVEVAMHAWLTKYTNSIRMGLSSEEAVKAAETFTAKSQAYTSAVNTAPLLRSRVFQNLAPLQNQAVAAARFISSDLWRGKTVTAAILPAFKLGISSAAAAILTFQIYGKSKLTPSDDIPLAGTVKRGMGGPVVSSGQDVLKNLDDGNPGGVATALGKFALLAQSKVPAGLQIIKGLKYLSKEQ